MNTLTTILAVGADPARPDFWATGIGKLIGGFLFVIGILVVLGAIVKGFGAVSKGKIGEAVKIGLGAAVLAAFLFQPSLIESLVDALGDIIKIVIDGGTEITDDTQGG